jgi:hypothetical protein
MLTHTGLRRLSFLVQQLTVFAVPSQSRCSRFFVEERDFYAHVGQHARVLLE